MADARALATDVGSGALWLEKILVRTAREVDVTRRPGEPGPIGELLAEIAAIADEPGQLEALAAELHDLRCRVPAELLEGADPVRLDPEGVRTALDDVASLLLPPLASTFCEVEMLTTESITFSAMSAIPSGPRALTGAAVASMLAALNAMAIPIRHRRLVKAGLAPVMSACLQRGRISLHTAPERVQGASICASHFRKKLVSGGSRFRWRHRYLWPLPWSRRYRRTNQISNNPTTADPIPTIRKILSGVASALFMARRIQAGLAANIRPSSTNRIPRPMRKSANAMDLIGRHPPLISASYCDGGDAEPASPQDV